MTGNHEHAFPRSEGRLIGVTQLGYEDGRLTNDGTMVLYTCLMSKSRPGFPFSWPGIPSQASEKILEEEGNSPRRSSGSGGRPIGNVGGTRRDREQSVSLRKEGQPMARFTKRRGR